MLHSVLPYQNGVQEHIECCELSYTEGTLSVKLNFTVLEKWHHICARLEQNETHSPLSF
jgi:hypothetical protein